jgi:hypothetical protein
VTQFLPASLQEFFFLRIEQVLSETTGFIAMFGSKLTLGCQLGYKPLRVAGYRAEGYKCMHRNGWKWLAKHFQCQKERKNARSMNLFLRYQLHCFEAYL